MASVSIQTPERALRGSGASPPGASPSRSVNHARWRHHDGSGRTGRPRVTRCGPSARLRTFRGSSAPMGLGGKGAAPGRPGAALAPLVASARRQPIWPAGEYQACPRLHALWLAVQHRCADVTSRQRVCTPRDSHSRKSRSMDGEASPMTTQRVKACPVDWAELGAR